MKKFYFLILLTGILLLIGRVVFGQLEGEGSEATSTPESILSWELPDANAPAFLDAGCGTIICDDFNAYNNGDLTGQLDWTGSSAYQVQEALTYEGAKAISCLTGSGDRTIAKTGNLTDTGQQVISIRIPNTSPLVRTPVNFDFYEGENARLQFAFLNAPKDIKYRDDGGAWVDFGDWAFDTWYYVKIEWRASDHLVQYSINGGGATGWIAPYSVWSSGMDKISFTTQGGGGSDEQNYFDYIEEYPYGEAPAVAEADVLNDTFFLIDYVFGDFPLTYFCSLLLLGIVSSFIYQMTKR